MSDLKPGDCCMWCEHSHQNGKWNGDFYFTYCNHPEGEGNVVSSMICDHFVKIKFKNTGN